MYKAGWAVRGRAETPLRLRFNLVIVTVRSTVLSFVVLVCLGRNRFTLWTYTESAFLGV